VGKSSLLSHIADVTSGQWLFRYQSRRDKNAEPVLGALDLAVPVHVPARSLAEAHAPIDRALHDSVRAKLGTACRTELPNDLFSQAPLAGASWLVLVDGLDEVIDFERRGQLIRNIVRDLDDRDSPYRFVISTRPLPETEMARLRREDTSELAVRAFDDARVRSFVYLWFKEAGKSNRDADEFLRRLERAPPDLLAIPLLLTMLLRVHHSDTLTPIPRCRTDLYEEFVAELLYGEDQSARTDTGLLRALAQTFGEGGAEGEQENVRLLDKLRQVIEYLAFASRERENRGRPLLDLAMPQLRLQPPSHHIRERTRALTILIRSGLVVEAGEDLAFIHESIREYLAACHLARRLNPDNPDAKKRIDCEIWSGHQQAAVFLLAQWGRRGKDIAPLISWLIHSTPSRAVLACLVIAEQPGVPAELASAVVRRVLGLARQRDMGEARFGQAIDALAAVEPTPELITSLAELLNDVDAWGSWGVHVALALARLGQTASAGEWLWRMGQAHLNDHDWWVAIDALVAAANYRNNQEVIAALIAHAIDAEPLAKLGIADALETLGGRAAAQDIVREFDGPRGLDAMGRVHLAERLRARGRHDSAVDLLLGALHEGTVDVRYVTEQLVRLGEGAMAADTLQSLFRSGKLYEWTLLRAVEELGDQGGELLCQLAADGTPSAEIAVRASRYRRVQAARSRLAQARQDATGGRTEDAAQTLSTICRDVWAESWVQEDAVLLLADLGDASVAHRVLSDLAADATLGARTRLATADALIRLEYPEPGREVLRSLAESAARHPEIGITAAQRLAKLGAPATAATALGVAIDGTVQPSVATELAEALAELDQSSAVIDRLGRLAADSAVPFQNRQSLILQLALLDERARAEEALNSVAFDSAAPPLDRISAASSLIGLGHRDAGVAALREMIESERTDSYLIGSACLTLAGIGEGKRATRVAEERVSDPSLDDDGRREAIRCLRQLGEVKTAVRLLRGLIADPVTEAPLRLRAAQELRELGNFPDTLEAVRALALNNALPGHIRVQAAGELARAGDMKTSTPVLQSIATDPTQENAVSQHAAKLLSDPSTPEPPFFGWPEQPASDRVGEAEALIARGELEAACLALRALLTGPHQLVGRERVRAAAALVKAGDRKAAVTALMSTLRTRSKYWWPLHFGSSPPPLRLRRSAAVRYRAATELIRLDERQAAIDELRAIATDYAEEPVSRLEAMQVLAQLGEADIARPLLRGMALDPDAPAENRVEAEITLAKCGWATHDLP
jgi:thioredoxin-like negative regulator of GroEL